MELRPAPGYRNAFKRGMSGTDVAALQINLANLTVDGIFGPATEKAVKEFQNLATLEVDGVAGILTQRSIVELGSSKAQTEFKLPGRMLFSIASNESGFALAAYGAHANGAGFDLGAFQFSFPSPGSQADYRHAYRVSAVASDTGARLRHEHDRFSEPPPVDSWYLAHIADGNRGRLAWQLAVFGHNWPEAAENIARQGSIFDDPSRDTQQADWIEAASGGRLSTPREWCVSYIERATTFVNWPKAK